MDGRRIPTVERARGRPSVAVRCRVAPCGGPLLPFATAARIRHDPDADRRSIVAIRTSGAACGGHSGPIRAGPGGSAEPDPAKARASGEWRNSGGGCGRWGGIGGSTAESGNLTIRYPSPGDAGSLASARTLEGMAWLNIQRNMARGTWHDGRVLVGPETAAAAIADPDTRT